MSERDQQEKLLNLIREVVDKDNALRIKYQVTEKFRFIRDRLQALQERLEKDFSQMKIEAAQENADLANLTTVFVYLFNAHGLTVRSWQNMLLPKVFYEYSVNRPIYTDKTYVEALIRSKKNKVQHGYFAVLVNPDDILKSGTEAKDVIGNPVVRVREGSLKFDKFVTFIHNEVEYTLNDAGELVKKE